MNDSDGDGPPPEPHGRVPRQGGRSAYLYLADQLAALRRAHEGLAAEVTDLASASSEILPRLGALEPTVERLNAALEAELLSRPDQMMSDELTPATQWSMLDRGGLEAAWNALGEWVAAVLNEDYRLTRVQLPDCWPVHRRAVRELAWLRTLHVATRDPTVSPEVVGEWHTRWLPAALHNIATAIDPRECAPGRHRLTDAERRNHHRRVEEAGDPLAAPALTIERRADRPRYFPDRMPARRGRQEDLDPQPRRQTELPPSLDELTPPGPSTPEHWWEYFLDARLEEIGSSD